MPLHFRKISRPSMSNVVSMSVLEPVLVPVPDDESSVAPVDGVSNSAPELHDVANIANAASNTIGSFDNNGFMCPAFRWSLRHWCIASVASLTLAVTRIQPFCLGSLSADVALSGLGHKTYLACLDRPKTHQEFKRSYV